MGKDRTNHFRTRRNFLGKTAAAGSYMLIRGIHGAVLSAQPVQKERPEYTGVQSAEMYNPVLVIHQSVSSDINPRAVTWIYITEILRRAGVFFRTLSPSDLSSLEVGTKSVAILAGDLNLSSEEKEILKDFIKKSGSSLIGIGGTSGMDDIFGVKEPVPMAEGWIKVTNPDHPVTRGLQSSLHVFGGKVYEAESAEVLAEIETNYQGPKGNVLFENKSGDVRAILLAPDLVFSIVNIQQGIPVLQDGKPAKDGTANINDGLLKAEDGMVLDWERDRTVMQPDGEPAFLEPVSDELREIILRSIFHLAVIQKISLPVLWYWPRDLPAIGHISHDSDGNDPDKAEAMLEVMLKRARIKSTWAILYPGYPKNFYRKLKDNGFEIGLHYDARTGGPDTSWSRENFLFQKQWLMEKADLDHIHSNKNHYTRWENRIDFFRWCEESGVESDETCGPSKKGTIGFAMGGSQPYYPIDDEGEKPRIMNVLEVNLITQDLRVVCPEEYGKVLFDSAFNHYGIAHFLFHPAHIQKPHVADALCELVDYGKDRGVEWWTNEQISQWEKKRRKVKAQFGSEKSVVFQPEENLKDATLIFLNPGSKPVKFLINGKTYTGKRRKIYGFDFDVIVTDLTGESEIQLL